MAISCNIKKQFISVSVAAALIGSVFLGVTNAAEEGLPPPGPGIPMGYVPPPSIPGYEPSTDPKDFSGLWRNSPMPGAIPFQLAPSIPFNATAQLRLEHGQAMSANNTPLATPHVMCRPTGVSQAVGPIAPIYVSQNNEKIVFMIIDEIRDVRQVYFEDRHPNDLTPSYGGHSIASWDGDTLLVDTIGYNGRGDLGGALHSANLHMTQKISKSADGTVLSMETTIVDPDTFTEPLVLEREWGWVNGQQPLEFDCEENPREDNFSGIVFEEEYLAPICVLYEGEGNDLSSVRCEAP